MELVQNRQKKKKDKKPLYILLAFIAFFSVFIYFITKPSKLAQAKKELEISFNKKDVEMVWYKYKPELYNNEEFLQETRKKLAGFNLSDEEITECKSWLPSAPVSINVVVVPDLSRRIVDTINNPNQIDNDLLVLNTAWKSFEQFSKLKLNTKDKLTVDVTDIDQAKGQFSAVANKLQFDLSSFPAEKSHRFYFSLEKEKQFDENIRELYQSAKQKPLGADYRFYFRRYLNNRLKKSTLFDNYVNKVVVITDGYLEATGKPADTKIYGYEARLHQAVTTGNVLGVITANQLNIPKVDIDLSNTEVLVCEVNERKVGKGYDFEILKAYWEDWLKRMNAKKVLFAQREQATETTMKAVSEFVTK